MKVWALKKYTGPDGETHEIGSEFDLPRNTDAEKADAGRLLDYGIVTNKESEVRAVSETSENDDRPARERRKS